MTIKKFLTSLFIGAALLAATQIATADDYIRHTVQRGETLYGIAHKYNVPYKVIEQLNPQASNGIKKGMEILIPTGKNLTEAQNKPAEQPTPTPEPTPVSPVEPTSPVEPITPEEPTVKPVDQPEAPTTPTVKAIPDVYFAQTGDTFESIAAKFGITVDQLSDLNPFVDPEALQVGTALRLKEEAPLVVEDIPSAVPAPIANPIANAPLTPTPELSSPELSVSPLDNPDIELPIAIPAPIDFTPDSLPYSPESTVLVLLPFMSENETLDKQAQRYGDFYRGLLLAAENTPGGTDVKIDIMALDTNDDIERLGHQLSNTLPHDLKVIIAPEDEKQLAKIAEFAQQNGVYVLNLFNVKDETYLNNPFFVQANISQQLMYDKAIEAFEKEYEGYIPVVLSSTTGKNEKKPFVDALKQRYSDAGKDLLEVSYNDMLKAADLDFLVPGIKYIFIPSSGSLLEFNKFAHTLNEVRSNSEDPDQISLFGYPDWTAFRSDARDMLHSLGANIYSRFYYDETSEDAKTLRDKYFSWYGTSMLEGVPMQGVLGYDAGNLVIKALRTGLPVGDVLRSGTTFRGVQSTFKFSQPQSQGFINDALYLIRFLPNRMTLVSVI